MKYGNTFLSGKFVLGPMAAYTDIAFRLLCRRNGAAMCFTEFSNANAIIRNVSATWQLMQTCKEELPVGIQIFGPDAATMAHAVKMINEKVSCGELFASCIDLNFGCPSGSVIRAGAGSALLRKPEKMKEIVEACVAASEIPITAKIRAGWSSDNTVPLAKLLENAGIAGITVHWRTATEGRKRQVGWQGMHKLKEEISVPLIANGGASSPELAVKLLAESGCDAVMISSGALGNPGIFQQANALLSGKPLLSGKECPAISWKEKIDSFAQYVSLAEKYNLLSPKRLRLHAIEFVSFQPGVKGVRKKLNSAKSTEEIMKIIQEFEPSVF